MHTNHLADSFAYTKPIALTNQLFPNRRSNSSAYLVANLRSNNQFANVCTHSFTNHIHTNHPTEYAPNRICSHVLTQFTTNNVHPYDSTDIWSNDTSNISTNICTFALTHPIANTVPIVHSAYIIANPTPNGSTVMFHRCVHAM